MVDDVEVAARSQNIVGAPSQGAHAPVVPVAEHIPLTVRDAVELSSDARRMVKQLQESQTVAEAFLANLTDPKRLIEEASSSKNSDMAGKDEEDAKKAMKNATNWAVNDIGWLFDALTLDKIDLGKLSEKIAGAVARDKVGTRPPLPEVMARARQSGSVAALFLEDVALTVQRSEVVDASVKRATVTTVHQSMRDRISDKNQPLLLDVSGTLQDLVLTNPGGGVGAESGTPNEPLYRSAVDTNAGKGEDVRHALLIIREGGAVQAGGTIRIRLDAVLPLG